MLILEIRRGHICNTRGWLPKRNSWGLWNEAYITIRGDTASWCTKHRYEKR